MRYVQTYVKSQRAHVKTWLKKKKKEITIFEIASAV